VISVQASIKFKLNVLLLTLVTAMSAASFVVYHFTTRSIDSYELIVENLLSVSRIPELVLEVNRDLESYQRAAAPELKASIEGRMAELVRLSREVRDKTPAAHVDSAITIDGVSGIIGSLQENVAVALAQIDSQQRTARLVESVETIDKIVGFSRHNVDTYVAQELRNMVPMREQTYRDNRNLSLALLSFVLMVGACALGLGILFTNRVIVRPLGEVIVASRKLAEGRFEGVVSQRRNDEIGALATAFQEMQGVLDRLLRETTRLFDAFRQGRMDVRGEAAAFSGSYQQLVSGINNVIDAVAASGEQVRQTNELLLAQVEERQRAQRERDAMHTQLLDTARKAGMAEIATSVLHNLGNALNSVNIAAESSTDLVKRWRVRDVSKVADMLEEHRHELTAFFGENGRGKLVPAYLRKLVEVLDEDRAQVLAELQELTRMLDHAKEVVAWQQSYAGVAGVREEISPVVLVEDALRITKVERDGERITIEKQFDDVPVLSVERHKVVQILVNLISNAAIAIERSGQPQGTLTLKIREEGGKAVTFEVGDNGIGLPAENMARLFQYGFTTREGGHGFGLHSCAITALELGGEIKAASDGTGKGARFMLTLPVQAS
jgi:signal transduction histidine kinase